MHVMEAAQTANGRKISTIWQFGEVEGNEGGSIRVTGIVVRGASVVRGMSLVVFNKQSGWELLEFAASNIKEFLDAIADLKVFSSSAAIDADDCHEVLNYSWEQSDVGLSAVRIPGIDPFFRMGLHEKFEVELDLEGLDKLGDMVRNAERWLTESN